MAKTSLNKIEQVNSILRSLYGKKEIKSLLDPLDTLIKTILSQNTSDKNSVPAFEALKGHYGTWEQVRAADKKSIEDIIRPAGLFRIKSKRIKEVLEDIHKTAKRTDLGFLKKLDRAGAEKFLRSLKGVGPKTLAIVMLFSLGHPYFPVDTHVLRVSKRLGLVPKKMSAEEAHEYFDGVIPAEMMVDLHLNLIEHGRNVCKAIRPKCTICKLRGLCGFYKKMA